MPVRTVTKNSTPVNSRSVKECFGVREEDRSTADETAPPGPTVDEAGDTPDPTPEAGAVDPARHVLTPPDVEPRIEFKKVRRVSSKAVAPRRSGLRAVLRKRYVLPVL